MLTLPTAARAIDVEVALPDHLHLYGTLTLARLVGAPDGPLVVALGGISANRFVAEAPGSGSGWWPGLVGRDCAIDPERHRILGLDFAADESGAAAPSTHDQAEVVAAAIRACGAGPAILVGASYGGMVALALAERWPELVSRLVIISAPAAPHPMSTAIRELQRRIVALGIGGGRAEEGLAIARGLAMTTYRTPEEFEARFAGGIDGADPLSVSAPGVYLRACGSRYSEIVSPGRFLSLSASIDRHRVDPRAISHPALVIGASSDRLVPPGQSRALAGALPDARLHILDCLYGHDMFLKEAEAIGALIAPFLEDA